MKMELFSRREMMKQFRFTAQAWTEPYVLKKHYFFLLKIGSFYNLIQWHTHTHWQLTSSNTPTLVHMQLGISKAPLWQLSWKPHTSLPSPVLPSVYVQMQCGTISLGRIRTRAKRTTGGFVHVNADTPREQDSRAPSGLLQSTTQQVVSDTNQVSWS